MDKETGVSNPAGSRTFDKWLESRPDLSRGTRRKYAAVVRMFGRSRDGVSVAGLGNFMSNHKQRHVKAALILYCKFLAKPDIAAELRDMRIRYPKKAPHAIPDLDEIMRVLEACDQETKHIGLFLLHTGCRIQEALTVKLNDFDEAGKVTVRDIKTEGKYREIYLPDKYFAELMDYLVHNKGVLGNQRIFYSSRKGSLESLRADFWDKLNAVSNRKIGRNLPTHDFRRFCATYLYNKTHDIEFVNRILGHSDISTTHKYTQYARQDQDLKKSKQILGGLRTRQSKTGAGQA